MQDGNAVELVEVEGVTGIIAPMVRDGPINGNWFEAYAGQVPVPHPGRSHVVLMDKLSSHKPVSG